MADERYIIISVAFEPGASNGQSLEWVAPELKDAGLTLIEEGAEPSPSRTWAGIVEGLTVEHLLHMRHLEGGPASNGHPDTDVYAFDGLSWEGNGNSPIVSVTLCVA
jgi:hypothetical protein